MYKFYLILFTLLWLTNYGQMIYTDVNPDFTIQLVTGINVTKSIDINNDGTMDFDIVAYKDIIMNYRSTLVPKNGNKFICRNNFADTLNANDSISQNSMWCTANSYLYNGIMPTTGFWLSANDKFIGVAITAPTGFYYGWIRMRNANTLDSYAYNATLNQPIVVGDGLPYVTESASLFDIANNGNGSDVKIKFTKAKNENKVSEYRVLMVPVQHINPFTLDSAKRVPLSKAFSVMPQNKNIDTVLNASSTDVYGTPISQLRTYKALVVSYPNLTTVFDTLMSLPTNSLTLTTPNLAASQPTVSSTFISANNYDINLKFNAPVTENGILNYRLYVIPSADSLKFNLDSANIVPPGNYITITPTSTNQSLNYLSPNLRTTKGLALTPFKKYKCVLMSYTDSLVSNCSSLSLASNNFTVYTQVQPVNTVWVEDVADNHNISDIKVSFKKAVNENNISEYRGIIVPKTQVSLFNLDSANNTTYYVSFTPNSSDQSIVLPATLKDYKGNAITETSTWYFYVLSVQNPLNSDVNALCTKPKYFGYHTPDYFSADCFQCPNTELHDIQDKSFTATHGTSLSYSLDLDSNGVNDVLFVCYASPGIGAYSNSVYAIMQNNTQMSCDITNPNGPFIIPHDSLDMNYNDLGWKTGTGYFRNINVQLVPPPGSTSAGGLWRNTNQHYMHLRLIGTDTTYAWVKILTPDYNKMTIYSYGIYKNCANQLPLSASSTASVSCTFEAVTLTANGANTYSWSTGNSGSNIIVNPSSTTSYTVYGTATNGCTGTAIITHSVDPGPSLTIASSSSVICTSESATLTANGAASYTWSNGSASQSIIVTPGSTESYTVNGSTMHGCSGTIVITQSVVTCAGIEEYSMNEITIYPNPTENSLHITDKENRFENANIKISNYLGQTVLEKEYSDSIDVSILPAGIYTLRITTKGNKSYYTKFIKE